ncbi:MAG TPA: hypothetical protein PKJ11_02280 [bacterium]|jgi:hypothetical protein|nr:MAG: hypothetical protein BWX53_00274 [Parcubacteria group bacterium ADurb.Bin016]HNU90144.1 hypothetical protein [bacterium]HRS73070.1 hypothetical protein [Patescibacteria group bacterium]HOE80993.1 hypothetical protein [bacterium]HOR69094.1 hypothetical protein [bacterium]
MKIIDSFKLLVNLLRLTLLAAAVLAIIYGSWFNLLIIVITLVFTFLPRLVEKKYKIYIPLDFEFVIIFFVYACLFLGEVRGFYGRFWWWDIFLHTFSAIAFCFLGFIAFFLLFKAEKIKTHPAWIAIFSFCFSLTVAVLWEIFEFTMDQVFETNMQKSGLMDTMGDLISASVSSLLVAVAGYIYLKSDQQSILYRWLDWIIKKIFHDRQIKKI